MRGHDRSGAILLGIAVALIVIWVAMRLVVLLGPAWVTGAIAYPSFGPIDQFRALLPYWLERVATENKWSLFTTKYLFTVALVICAIWALLAVLLTARVPRARIATFVFIGLLAVHSILLQIFVPNRHLHDAFSIESVTLYVLLFILLTRKSVVAMFPHENA